MQQHPDNVADALDAGEVLWPGAQRQHDGLTDEDTFVELLSGRRRFVVVDTSHGYRVGDFVTYYYEGREHNALTFVITLLWEHDGILAGWAIASLRPVRITLGE